MKKVSFDSLKEVKPKNANVWGWRKEEEDHKASGRASDPGPASIIIRALHG